MTIGEAILALIKGDHARIAELQRMLMQVCNEYDPACVAASLPDAHDTSLEEILRLGLEVWVSGVGIERAAEECEKLNGGVS